MLKGTLVCRVLSLHWSSSKMEVRTFQCYDVTMEGGEYRNGGSGGTPSFAFGAEGGVL